MKLFVFLCFLLFGIAQATIPGLNGGSSGSNIIQDIIGGLSGSLRFLRGNVNRLTGTGDSEASTFGQTVDGQGAGIQSVGQVSSGSDSGYNYNAPQQQSYEPPQQAVASNSGYNYNAPQSSYVSPQQQQVYSQPIPEYGPPRSQQTYSAPASPQNYYAVAAPQISENLYLPPKGSSPLEDSESGALGSSNGGGLSSIIKLKTGLLSRLFGSLGGSSSGAGAQTSSDDIDLDFN